MIKKAIIHGLEVVPDYSKYAHQIIQYLKEEQVEIAFTRDFAERNPLLSTGQKILEEADATYDVVFSLGGDGTFLESVLFVGALETPVLGINMGRLGFLASIPKESVAESLQLLFHGKYELEKRTLVTMEADIPLFDGKCFALNECAILRKDLSSMIMIKSYINDQFLNTYWADGLMVSTPTGSTGYSLSCGGPLMMPDAKNFVITPVSPHNLNVRPLIISDDAELKFQIETRDRSYLISLDSRSETIDSDITIVIKKASFYGTFIRIEGSNYPDTIRNKLGWGFDKRN